MRTKRCKFQGCEKIPSYGFSCKSREYCKPHALQGMVYSAGSRCRFRGCGASGVYNHPGVRGGSFCQDHKEVRRGQWGGVRQCFGLPRAASKSEVTRSAAAWQHAASTCFWFLSSPAVSCGLISGAIRCSTGRGSRGGLLQ